DGAGHGVGVEIGEGRGGGRDEEAAPHAPAGRTVGNAAIACAPAVRRIAGERAQVELHLAGRDTDTTTAPEAPTATIPIEIVAARAPPSVVLGDIALVDI